MSAQTDWFSIVIVIFIVVLSAGWLINRRDDRKAIVSNIEADAGKVIEITRVGNTEFEREYDVTYITSEGTRVQASCRTDGAVVRWLSNRPPME